MIGAFSLRRLNESRRDWFVRRRATFITEAEPAAPTRPYAVPDSAEDLSHLDSARRILVLSSDIEMAYGRHISPSLPALTRRWRERGLTVVGYTYPSEGGLGLVGFRDGLYDERWQSHDEPREHPNTVEFAVRDGSLPDLSTRAVFIPDVEVPFLLAGEHERWIGDAASIDTILRSDSPQVVASSMGRIADRFDYTVFDTFMFSSRDARLFAKRFAPVLGELTAQVLDQAPRVFASGANPVAIVVSR